MSCARCCLEKRALYLLVLGGLVSGAANWCGDHDHAVAGMRLGIASIALSLVSVCTMATHYWREWRSLR